MENSKEPTLIVRLSGLLLTGLFLLLLRVPAVAAPFAYIAESRDDGGVVTGNMVSVVDTATRTVVNTLQVGNGPVGVAVSPNGDRVYVTNSASKDLSVIDATTNPPTVSSTVAIGVDHLRGVAVSHDGRYVYMTNYSGPGDDVYVVDATVNAVVSQFSHGGLPYGLAAHPSRDLLYLQLSDDGAGIVSVIDATAAGTYPELARISFGTTCLPSNIAVDPLGAFVYVPCRLDNALYIIDTVTNTVTARVGSLPNASFVAVHPSGNFVYVTNETNTIFVVDTTSPYSITTIQGVGIGPQAPAFEPTGMFAYVPNHDSNTVSVIDTVAKSIVDSVSVGDGPHGFGQFIVAYNTPSGSNVAVSAGGGVTLSFTDVLQAGTTKATLSASPPAAPSGFVASGSYFDVTSTAVFSGSIKVTIPFDPLAVPDPTQLRLYHFDGGQWVDVTVVPGGIDLVAHTVSGVVTSLSPFVVGTPFIFDGLRQPINSDNSSVFKLNGTVPVKFGLTMPNGKPLSPVDARLFLAKWSDGVIGTIQEGTSTNAPDAGNAFRYDASGNQYIFNLGTKQLSVGTWQLQVAVNGVIAKRELISLK